MALVRTDVSEERIASIIRAKRISKLEITLAVTSRRHSSNKPVTAGITAVLPPKSMIGQITGCDEFLPVCYSNAVKRTD
jgi:hypothetical protein